MMPFSSFIVLVSAFFAQTFEKEFATIQTTWINGHKYYGRSEQPYFRVKHSKHTPILVSKVNESDFGKHDLPDDDVFIEHDWTDEEAKYMPCLDLLCLCPYYNGTVQGDQCILPNGQELKRAVRREYRALDDEERTQIEQAIRKMHSSGIYNRLGRVHKYGGLHSGPGFFPWHREYLKRIEFVLRRFLPMGSELGLPYWDSTMDAYLPNVSHSIMFSKYLTGDVNEKGEMIYGPYANMSTMEGNPMMKRFLENNTEGELVTEARIDVILDQRDVIGVLSHSNPIETCSLLKRYQLDERFFEYTHDYVHYYIGGDFEETHTSTNDPIFFWHHTFIDSIWQMWREKMQSRSDRETEYPPPDPNCFPEKHFLNASMDELLGRTIGFLFCDTVNFERPKCQAKVKFGGNCTGYEQFRICFEGSCQNGVCAEEPTMLQRLWRFIKSFLNI